MHIYMKQISLNRFAHKQIYILLYQKHISIETINFKILMLPRKRSGANLTSK